VGISASSHLRLSKTSTSMRIALAQTAPENLWVRPGTYTNEAYTPEAVKRDIELLAEGLNYAAEYAADAAKRGAQVVCFPEYFLQGILDNGRQVCSPENS
jgi:predicted amidohydrolase